MLYPMKFTPIYKDYIWGGRNFEKLGRVLPQGNIAESWEISCHPDGISIISNGEFKGMSLTALIAEHGKTIIGNALPPKDIIKFPLLVKFIDANQRLSVQVHPDDEYARLNENGEYGKSEMWYIISAKPGAQIIYDVLPGVDKNTFSEAVKAHSIEACLQYVNVFEGDVINIPAGVVHAIGEGIMLAEIQQNSNTTYRVFDFDRMDKNGLKRPLHIEKALDVIDFDSKDRLEKVKGIRIPYGNNYNKTYLIANNNFAVELYNIKTDVSEKADGNKFFIYVFTEGSGKLEYSSGNIDINAGESILIPACLGEYRIKGKLTAIKAYVPNIEQDFIAPLQKNGYEQENFRKYCSIKL